MRHLFKSKGIVCILLCCTTLARSRAQAPWVGFTGGAFYASENDRVALAAIFPPQFDGHGTLTAPASVKFDTADGTLVAGKDYISTDGVITFNPGDDPKAVREINIQLIDNARVDPNPLGTRYFFLRLFGASGGVEIRDPDQVKVYVSDNELNGIEDFTWKASFSGGSRPIIGRYYIAVVPLSVPNEAGKIWLADTSGTVAKMNADGSPDIGFRISAPETHVEPLLLLPDGQMLAVGSDVAGPPHLIKLKPDGSENPPFQRSTNYFAAAALQKSGNIVTVGHRAFPTDEDSLPSSYVARLKPGGESDQEFQRGAAFGSEILGVDDAITAMAVDSLDRIIISGGFTQFQNLNSNGDVIAQFDCPGLARLLSNGSFDKSFRPQIPRYVYNMAIDAIGGIFILGPSGLADYNVALTRLNPDGSTDTSFNVDATVGPADSLMANTKGGLIVYNKYRILRLDANGSEEAFFTATGSCLDSGCGGLCPFTEARYNNRALAFDSFGRVVVTGPCSWSAGQAFGSNVRRFDLAAVDRQQFKLTGDYGPVTEAAGFIRIHIARTGESSQAASVDFATVDDTAKAGRDYTSMTGHIDFAPLEVERIIEVPLIDNQVVDGDRQFGVALRNPSPGYILPLAAQFRIADDEVGFRPGSISFLESGNLRVTFFNSAPTCRPILLQGSSDLRTWSTAQEQVNCDYYATFELKAGELPKYQFFRVVARP